MTTTEILQALKTWVVGKLETYGILLTQHDVDLKGLRDMIEQGNMGDVTVKNINSQYMPQVCATDIVTVYEGAPTVPPMFVGQIWVNTSVSPSRFYVAYQVTGSTNDWK